jgi:hypothetical protein
MYFVQLRIAPRTMKALIGLTQGPTMLRTAERYRSVVEDLVLSLQALAASLTSAGHSASCYVCGDGRDRHGASFVANLSPLYWHQPYGQVPGLQFQGISWVESRDGHELVKFEGAEARSEELQRVAGAPRRTTPHRSIPFWSARTEPAPLIDSGAVHQKSRPVTRPVQAAQTIRRSDDQKTMVINAFWTKPEGVDGTDQS